MECLRGVWLQQKLEEKDKRKEERKETKEEEEEEKMGEEKKGNQLEGEKNVEKWTRT